MNIEAVIYKTLIEGISYKVLPAAFSIHISVYAADLRRAKAASTLVF